MPIKDLELRREYKRRYYIKNKDRSLKDDTRKQVHNPYRYMDKVELRKIFRTLVDRNEYIVKYVLGPSWDYKRYNESRRILCNHPQFGEEYRANAEKMALIDKAKCWG